MIVGGFSLLWALVSGEVKGLSVVLSHALTYTYLTYMAASRVLRETLDAKAKAILSRR